MFKRGLSLALLSAVIVTISTPWATSQQESQQEATVPAYNSGPPPRGTKLPAILAKEQLWGENAQYPFQTHAYELAPGFRPYCISSRAIAIATAWATTVFTVALRTRTERSAPPA